MSRPSRHLSFALAVGAATLGLLSGCGISVDDGSSKAPSTAAPSPSTAAPVPSTAAPVPSSGTPLLGRVLSSTRPVTSSTAEVKGDPGGRYENALSLWAGCEGNVDEVQFDISGHKVFQVSLGLRSTVPDDMQIEVLILRDGEPIHNLRLDGTDPTPPLLPVRILTEGGRTMSMETKVSRGTCTTMPDSYAVAVNGYVD